ncbi:MAG: SDR family NAD(P)-dependent oxidoreductase [Candidatus Peribacteraceae bacterium]
MKVLVTGSSGTVGTRLCEKLLAQGSEVVGVDWRSNEWKPEIDALTIKADLRDEASIDLLPKDVDAVAHLAANARVYELVKDTSQARDNFITTFNVLEFARRNAIPRFLFTSSRETYGNTHDPVCTEDKARIENCESAYTASKIGGEALVEAYKRCYGMGTVIVRLSNVYGMYDNSDRVVPLFIRQAKAGELLTVFGEEKCLDFTYIDDTMQGLLLILEKFDDVKNETYNIAYGKGTTIVHLAEIIKELLGSSSEIRIDNNRPGEVIKYTADIAKARRALGFAPTISFEDGIRKTIEWYAAHT